MEIPVISRLYLTGAFLSTAACAIDLITPFSLYFNWTLVMQGQVWRLITAYLYFGLFSVDFLFHMYFLVRYSRLLEEGDFRGRTAHYVWFILFGIANMTLVATYWNVHFLGSALTFMMTYVWGRRNEDVKMSFLGILTFHAPYLPWVMLTFSVLIGNAITMDLIGIAGEQAKLQAKVMVVVYCLWLRLQTFSRASLFTFLIIVSLVGHLYYFLEYVYPKIAQVRGFRIKRVMEPPALLHYLCGSYQPAVANVADEDDPLLEEPVDHAHQD